MQRCGGGLLVGQHCTECGRRFYPPTDWLA
ncbi:zinc ribbon domain-containing protein [Pseudomonas sp. K2I15]